MEKTNVLVEIPCIDLKPMSEVVCYVELTREQIMQQFNLSTIRTLEDLDHTNECVVWSYVYRGYGNIWTEDGQWLGYKI